MHYREGVGCLLIRLIIKRREIDAYRAVSSCLRQSRLICLLKFYQHMYMYRHIYNLQLEKREKGRERGGGDNWNRWTTNSILFQHKKRTLHHTHRPYHYNTV